MGADGEGAGARRASGEGCSHLPAASRRVVDGIAERFRAAAGRIFPAGRHVRAVSGLTRVVSGIGQTLCRVRSKDPVTHWGVVLSVSHLFRQGTPMWTHCECGYDCADFISRHDIAEGAHFECPACGAGRLAVAREATSAGVDCDGVILRHAEQHLTHDLR